ncbi:MAG: choice-of-anchor D domain-containing protein [Alphaproteobacteria bacterium]|nr:choice-of-anchor D domain-containing protein [Alphaproteobacteria bacterium]
MRLVAIGLGILGLAACQEYSVNGKPPTEEPPPVEDTDVPPPPPPPPGTPVPDIEISPASVDFGGWPADCASPPATVTISNVGDADLVINDVFFGTGTAEFTQNGAATTLTPGSSTQVLVDFAPASIGTFSVDLMVASNDPDESVATVPLTGDGLQGNLIQEGFAQVGSVTQPVDILFVIDNSDSMLDDVNALRNNFNLFIQGFLTLGLDYQIGVVTTDMVDPLQSGRLQGPLITTSTPDPVAQFSVNADVGTNGSIDEMGLAAAYAALTPPIITNENLGLVRPGSLLSIIVISDEPDQSSITAPEMITFLDAYQGDPALTSLSIVGGPKTGILPCWRGIFPAAPVPKYWNVALNTGGIHANICNLDMSVILQQLAIVAAGLEDSFTLTNVPADPSQIEVRVDGVLMPEDLVNGWSYDAGTNTVYFHGTEIPPAGSDVTVEFPGNGTCP